MGVCSRQGLHLRAALEPFVSPMLACSAQYTVCVCVKVGGHARMVYIGTIRGAVCVHVGGRGRLAKVLSDR